LESTLFDMRIEQHYIVQNAVGVLARRPYQRRCKTLKSKKLRVGHNLGKLCMCWQLKAMPHSQGFEAAKQNALKTASKKNGNLPAVRILGGQRFQVSS